MKSLRRDRSSHPHAANVSSKIFVRTTKSGKVQKIVRELYLRQDIPCSSKLCPSCLSYAPTDANGNITPFVLSERPAGTKAFPRGHYLMPDTNALLNGMDLFEQTSAFYDVIVLQTVLEELKNQSLPLYNRLISLIRSEEKRYYLFFNEFRLETHVRRQRDESINDRNDRAVRRAANWYSEHLSEVLKQSRKNYTVPAIVVITDDKDNILKAKKEGVSALSLSDYVAGLDDADRLLDMVNESRSAHDAKLQRGQLIYPEYYSMSKLMTGLRAGTLHQGIFNVSPYNYLEGSVQVAAFDKSLLILGRENSNRAIAGDLVVVEILPKDQWKSPSTKIVDEEALTKDENPESEENEAVVTERERRALQEEVRKAHGTNPEGRPQPTARVVGVIKRNWRQYVGNIDGGSFSSEASSGRRQQAVFVIPMDKRVPKIKIRTRQASELLGQRILITIDAWDRDSRYPTGHFVRSLGELETKGAETEALLLEYDVQYRPFSQAVLNCLPPEGHSWKVPGNLDDPLWKDRKDLRDLLVCSIDPPGCQDIDDTLHSRPLPNGNFEVGVHIADVSHFVQPNNAMDIEASMRGTTVYLVDKRIDMLPMLLGTDLCSLKPYVERFAFSVIWEMTPDAEIVSANFTKSVILSKEAFSYEQAQLRIDDESKKDELTQSMRTLLRMSKILRQKRMDAGALNLASPEVRIETESELNDPVADVKTKALLATNSLVEEFMLLANITVASRIYQSFPQTALLRRHATPPPQNFEQLIAQLSKKRGLTLDVSSSLALANSLDKCVDPSNPFFNTLIRILATRCMTSAEYFCAGAHAESEFRHYGLASSIYTHFTSPIRRYADLVVHRQLAAAIGYEGPGASVGEGLATRSKLEDICKNINHRHRNAQFAGRASIEYYVGQALKARGEMEAAKSGNENGAAAGVDEEGYVMRVFDNGIVVFVPRFGIEGVVRLEDFLLPGQKVDEIGVRGGKHIAARRESEFDPEEYALRVREKQHEGEDGGEKVKAGSVYIELFEKVKVNVSSVKEEGVRGAGKRRVRILVLGKA
ncbi:exosome complex exonuclease RRP44, putative [Coccidioides posadasii C735 delta SOWgp]|uniref:Chromosome disjunction protein 3 n=1 Tax=Coccidioides posadasii (strain C735) TaxID=222929 RepID=C5P5V5_COCP7|nr:exosome complex exonuclease RRP44, putative [Coccidioides posadasii C735 delta SOWgp]EER28095.1 exosome complex exonuclease RRP44, putative [Coccidioides posadasii C735 delta SOWgp]|eukprot:XP_003070240.1 exosome complex exonuclease RRP44, putative [Coccidioides posadasii C735 delta SOWgp]